MFDVPVVVRVAREINFIDLADWIDGNRQVYSDSIVAGKFIFEDGISSS
jgi:hypothetical protein